MYRPNMNVVDGLIQESDEEEEEDDDVYQELDDDIFVEDESTNAEAQQLSEVSWHDFVLNQHLHCMPIWQHGPKKWKFADDNKCIKS